MAGCPWVTPVPEFHSLHPEHQVDAVFAPDRNWGALTRADGNIVAIAEVQGRVLAVEPAASTAPATNDNPRRSSHQRYPWGDRGFGSTTAVMATPLTMIVGDMDRPNLPL